MKVRVPMYKQIAHALLESTGDEAGKYLFGFADLGESMMGAEAWAKLPREVQSHYVRAIKRNFGNARQYLEDCLGRLVLIFYKSPLDNHHPHGKAISKFKIACPGDEKDTKSFFQEQWERLEGREDRWGTRISNCKKTLPASEIQGFLEDLTNKQGAIA